MDVINTKIIANTSSEMNGWLITPSKMKNAMHYHLYPINNDGLKS